MSEPVARVRGISSLVTLLVLGCARNSVELERLLRDAHEDKVRAAAEYGRHRINVTGTVADAGLTKVEQYSATQNVDTATLHRALEGYLYVVLTGNDSKGRLVCFFGRNDMRTLGKFKQGARLTVEGSFQEYVEDGDVMTVVLTGCKEK
jgi:hypothetical protein